MIAFVQQYLTSVMAALAIMSVAYFTFWYFFANKLGRRKIQLSTRAGWPQIKDEVIATLLSFIGSTAFMFVILSFRDKGLTKFYISDSFGWYEGLTVIVMVLISDAWFYWSHRAMHHPSVYKYVHALHHRSLDVNPYTSTSFHVIEAILLTIWILPLALVMPISMAALGIVQVLGSLNNLKSHLGYEFFPKSFAKITPFNMLVTATNHSLHHTQYNGNYGLFFRFWDIVCGTEISTTKAEFNSIHERTQYAVIDNTYYRELIIDKIVHENSDTVSLHFKPSDKNFYQYKAGQYLTLKIAIGNQVYHRCFSLSSSPGIDDFLRITVKLKGAVSHYFYHTCKVGDRIKSLLPVGDFTLIPNTDNGQHYILVAGGSGITPLFSMLKQILNFEPKSTVQLLYASVSEQSILFKDELEQLAVQYPQFSCTYFISGKKRIQKNDLLFSGEANYYICGPESLKKDVVQYLKELTVASKNINTEHFADGYIPWFGIGQQQTQPRLIS